MKAHPQPPHTARSWGICTKVVLPLAGVAFIASVLGVALIHQALSAEHGTAKFVMAFLAAIVLSCVATYALLWRVVITPVLSVARVARTAGDGDTDVRVGWSRGDEIGQLGQQVDYMLDEIDRRGKQERAARERAVETQHAAESALAELRCFKFALDQHAILAVTDRAGVITYANDKFVELSKYSRDELVGQTHRLINSGRHNTDFWRAMWKTIRRGDVWKGEICNRAKDGSEYWVDTTIVPFRDGAGKIQQYVAIRSEVTQRKRVEANLAQQERQFRTLVNNIPGVPYRCVCDAHWTMLFVSEAVSELTGYPASDFINNQVRSFASIIHPDDRQRVDDAVQLAVGKGKRFSLEYRIVRADGEIRRVAEQGQMVDCEQDSDVRLLDGAIFDISDRKRAEEALLAERARLTAFVEHAPAALVMLDRDMRVLAISQRFLSEMGLDDDVLGRPYDEVMANLPTGWTEATRRGLRGEVTVCDDDVWRHPDTGVERNVRWEVRPWKSPRNEVGGILVFLEDISSMKRAEAALRESKEQFELAVRGSSDGIWDWNVMTGEVFYSHRYKELLGYREDDEFPALFETFRRHLHPEDAPATLQALTNHLEHEMPYDVSFRLRTRHSSWRWFRSRGEAVRGADGRARRMAGSISDISSLKQVEEELTRAAGLDKLTGLPNRGLFLERLQRVIDKSQQASGYLYAVMFLDFDRFKIINDSLGHDTGDALLIEIAKELRHNIRGTDLLNANLTGHLSARLGGDEFVVLLDDLEKAEDAETIANRLLQAFSKPRQLGKYEVFCTASIGIVMSGPGYRRAEDVVRDADTAMYEAKRRGKNRYVLFDASMRERVQRRMTLETDLHKAIGQPQLQICYQPILSLKTGGLYGVEALLRWKHPTEGLVEPTEFVPIAEESELILTLDEWVMEQACLQMASWQASVGGGAPTRVSINISRKTFARPDLVSRFKEVIVATGVDPKRIQLETTEDAFVSDIAAAVRTMESLKELGVELAIDGFGCGTSSFASLHQFPVDVLKIDQMMLEGIEDSTEVASMVHGLAVIVRNLGVNMVAKGVATVGQVIALQELGCEYAQGFFFSEALNVTDVEAYAARNSSLQYQAKGAAAYANQWGDRLAVFESFDGQGPLRPSGSH